MIHNSQFASNDWRAYLAKFGPRLLLFARQWLPDVADAEDAVQEAFVRFWRKHREPDDSHAGLLFASVRCVAIDHIRSESRRRLRELTASDDAHSPWCRHEEAPLFKASAVGHAQAVETALDQLPYEQREVLVLKIWGELTFAQIGEALDLSQNTAASRYRYAIATLRKLLRPVSYE